MAGFPGFNRTVIYSFFFVFTLLFYISHASGQVRAPSGSYQETCRGIQVVGSNLIAQCKNIAGDWKNSTLVYATCEGDIRNDNGQLKCKQKIKPAKALPAGSYKRTCQNMRIDGDYLRAKCEKKNGVWNNTKIKYKKCSGDIWNDNGELTCKDSGSKNTPSGSYKKSCRDYYVDGNRLYAKCEKKNGRWNDSSINYKNCNKDIWNDNGVLTCGNKENTNLPKGSYKKTCKDLYVDGNILEARCLNKNDKYSHTSINYKKCNKGIWNDSGKLRCN
ncbi:MAG: CVNH domain-containing protein [Deltaproteobacteria bacterium]